MSTPVSASVSAFMLTQVLTLFLFIKYLEVLIYKALRARLKPLFADISVNTDVSIRVVTTVNTYGNRPYNYI